MKNLEIEEQKKLHDNRIALMRDQEDKLFEI